MAVDNVVKLGAGQTLIDDLEALLVAAREGRIVALCGYAVFPNSDVVSINTNHGIVNNGCMSYCSILLARLVGDGSDE